MSIEAVSWALGVPVGGNAKVVLLGLANHAHPDGTQAYPALDTLARYANCDRSTARRNVRKLAAEGWIQPDGLGPCGQSKYSLRLDVPVPQDGFNLEGLVLPPWRKCVYCHADADVLDHVVPKAAGGSDGPTNRVPACVGCNRSKGALDLEAWAARDGRDLTALLAAVGGWQNATHRVAFAPGGGGTGARRGVALAPPEPSFNRPEPSVPPAGASEADPIFGAWVIATGRDEARTQLTPDRRRIITRALATHGVDDCLAAVRNIGASPDARSGYGRGTRFDDIGHALGTAERIEKWRDWQAPVASKRNGSQRPAFANAGDLDRFNDSEV